MWDGRRMTTKADRGGGGDKSPQNRSRRAKSRGGSWAGSTRNDPWPVNILGPHDRAVSLD